VRCTSRDRHGSVAGEFGVSGSFVEQAVHADGAVLGAEQAGEQSAFEGEAGVEVGGESFVDGFFRGAERAGRAVGVDAGHGG